MTIKWWRWGLRFRQFEISWALTTTYTTSQWNHTPHVTSLILTKAPWCGYYYIPTWQMRKLRLEVQGSYTVPSWSLWFWTCALTTPSTLHASHLSSKYAKNSMSSALVYVHMRPTRGMGLKFKQNKTLTENWKWLLGCTSGKYTPQQEKERFILGDPAAFNIHLPKDKTGYSHLMGMCIETLNFGYWLARIKTQPPTQKTTAKLASPKWKYFFGFLLATYF